MEYFTYKREVSDLFLYIALSIISTRWAFTIPRFKFSCRTDLDNPTDFIKLLKSLSETYNKKEHHLQYTCIQYEVDICPDH